MKIEIDERDILSLPNDVDLGSFVRKKFNSEKNAQQEACNNVEKPSWSQDQTPCNFNWDSDLAV
jgi:hypothetical protein